MELDIGNISGQTPVRKPANRNRTRQPRRQEQEREIPQFSSPPEKAEIESYMRKIFRSNLSFIKKLKYSVNEELGQVVVKVIDPETDKVIKEIPPAELQRLHIRIREAIGLLIDKEI